MKTRFALVTALVVVAPLFSQSEPLTLDACRKLARERHPALTAAQAGVAGAREAVGEAKAPYVPQLDLNAGYHRWQRRAFLPAGLSLPGRDTPTLIGPLDDWNGSVSSRWTIYDFGERRAGLDAAHARAAGADADAQTTRADIRLNVDQAFFALAEARDLQAVAEQNFTRTETHRQLAQARREAGAVPQADVLRLDAELANARLQVIAAQSRTQIAAGQLNTAMGQPASTPIAIKPDATVPPPPSTEALANAVSQALAQRSELTAAEKRTAAARAAVISAQASRAPKLRADASYGWRDTTFVPETKEWQAGLSIDLPLFDGGSRSHHIARSKADLAREEATFAQRRLAVQNEVWAASSELGRAWASIAANETGVRASEESLRVTRERYERGAALVTDLLDTQIALARAESSLADARWSYCAARASFDRAIGSAGL